MDVEQPPNLMQATFHLLEGAPTNQQQTRTRKNQLTLVASRGRLRALPIRCRNDGAAKAGAPGTVTFLAVVRPGATDALRGDAVRQACSMPGCASACCQALPHGILHPHPNCAALVGLGAGLLGVGCPRVAPYRRPVDCLCHQQRRQAQKHCCQVNKCTIHACIVAPSTDCFSFRPLEPIATKRSMGAEEGFPGDLPCPVPC